MDDWLTTTIGDQATLQRGIDITRAQQTPGVVPVISSGGISSYHNSAAVRGPGVVLGRKGVVGSVFYVEEDFWPHDTTLWVKDFHGNNPRFVYYFFRGIVPYIASLDVGSANPTLNRNHLHPMEVRWPPIGEQERIANILGTLDDKIELNRRMSETIESMARALFNSWFVDFDPVRAKAEGRDTGLQKEIADLFPDSFEESELGEIPRGWGVGSFEEEFKLTMGQSPPGNTLSEGKLGNPFFQGSTDFGARFPTQRISSTSPTRWAQQGDTLISVRAPVGAVNMASENCAIGRGVAAARHTSGAGSYTYYFIKSLDKAFAMFNGEGTVFGSISRKDFEGIRIVTAPKQVVASYDRICGPIDIRIGVLAAETRSLVNSRDALLPQLLSGGIRTILRSGEPKEMR